MAIVTGRKNPTEAQRLRAERKRVLATRAAWVERAGGREDVRQVRELDEWLEEIRVALQRLAPTV